MRIAGVTPLREGFVHNRIQSRASRFLASRIRRYTSVSWNELCPSVADLFILVGPNFHSGIGDRRSSVASKNTIKGFGVLPPASAMIPLNIDNKRATAVRVGDGVYFSLEALSLENFRRTKAS